MAKVEIIQAYAPNLSSRIQLHVIQDIDDLNHMRMREEPANALIVQIGEAVLRLVLLPDVDLLP